MKLKKEFLVELIKLLSDELKYVKQQLDSQVGEKSSQKHNGSKLSVLIVSQNYDDERLIYVTKSEDIIDYSRFVENAISKLKSRLYDVVLLKPSYDSSLLGSSDVKNGNDFIEIVKYVNRHSPSTKIILEEYCHYTKFYWEEVALLICGGIYRCEDYISSDNLSSILDKIRNNDY